MAVYSFEDKIPEIGEGTWIAPSAEIVGDVTIGKNCYIGFGAVIRGDFGKIVIGDESAIEEGVIIHCASNVEIGKRVIVGHMAMIHDSVIEDYSLIGMQSMICDYSYIKKWTIIGEKSMVKKKQVIPSNKIYGGMPATEIGDLTSVHKEFLEMGQQLYADLSGRYKKGFKRIR